MSVDTTQELFSRLEIEISKFMDITTIFRRLKEQGYLTTIHSMFYKIFYNEHDYTIQELIKMAQKDPNNFNIKEHYKMNSHIFKQNLNLITNLVIDDLWVTFNSLMMQQILTDQNQRRTGQSLEQIDELSNEQIGFDSKLSPINQKYNEEDASANINEDVDQQRTLSLSNQKPKNKQIIQEYKNQLDTIMKIRTKQKPEENVFQKNLEQLQQNFQQQQEDETSQKSNRGNQPNQTRSSCTKTAQQSSKQHMKSPSFDRQKVSSTNIIAPTQQNYKTMQYLQQMVQKDQKDDNYKLNGSSQQFKSQPGGVVYNSSVKKSPANTQKSSKHEQHLKAIGQQDQFNETLQKKYQSPIQPQERRMQK